MVGALSVTLSDCFMNKMEKDVAIPFKPKFYCPYTDRTYSRRNRNQPDELYERMNKYHPNINLTIEVNPSKFLDTNISRENNETKYSTYHKEMKLPFHWMCAVPKQYKNNVIIGDLRCVKNLSLNFEQEVRITKDKYMKAGYSFHFINSEIDGFNQEKEDLLIPATLFEERKEVSFQILFCKQNENEISCIIDKLEAFTNYKV